MRIIVTLVIPDEMMLLRALRVTARGALHFVRLTWSALGNVTEVLGFADAEFVDAVASLCITAIDRARIAVGTWLGNV